MVWGLIFIFTKKKYAWRQFLALVGATGVWAEAASDRTEAVRTRKDMEKKAKSSPNIINQLRISS